MKYFIDTEFIESGPRHPIQLISIGIVDENGCEFYRISSEFDASLASAWVRANVLAQIPESEFRKSESLKEIAEQLKAFIGDDKEPEFWGYYADYDWVVFCQIFGAMIDLPKNCPMYCLDIRQLAHSMGNPPIPKQESDEHNALADARWNKTAYDFLTLVTPVRGTCTLSRDLWWCRKCKRGVGVDPDIMHDPEYFAGSWKFCPKCGSRMDWQSAGVESV